MYLNTHEDFEAVLGKQIVYAGQRLTVVAVKSGWGGGKELDCVTEEGVQLPGLQADDVDWEATDKMHKEEAP